MLPITDNRPDCEVMLYKVEPTGFFIWGDELYRRVETTIEADIRYTADGIPCIHQRSGELQLIGREAWVVPCKCELTIVEG